MDIQWKTILIHPENLINISRGDPQRVLKYLRQFKELIPQRIEILKDSLRLKDRKKTRQVLHQLIPQLQFFGIPGVVKPIRRLEHEYETIPMKDLTLLIDDIVSILEQSCSEVNMLITINFERE